MLPCFWQNWIDSPIYWFDSYDPTDRFIGSIKVHRFISKLTFYTWEKEERYTVEQYASVFSLASTGASYDMQTLVKQEQYTTNIPFIEKITFL